jgi:glycine hydroxymethyltransferase
MESFADCFSRTKPYCIGCGGPGESHREKKAFSYSELNHAVKKSCLYDEHKKRTKNIIEFAGWEMPIRYSGIIDEHRAVRHTCGLFDITHMGVLEVSGQYATQFIDIVSSNYVSWIDENESQYSYLLDPQGAVIDDIMIYKLSYERYIIVVNAINNDKDIAWLQAVNSREYSIEKSIPEIEVQGRVSIKDLKDPTSGIDRKVNIALQGPRSLDLLKEIASNERKRYKLERLEKAHFLHIELGGMGLIVSRTGYTGEEVGYELFVHPDNAPQLWTLLLEKGKKFGLVPVGLGARDSLRIEAGLPLYGHELAGVYNISPLEAGFGPYVKFHKPFFIGRTELLNGMRESKYEVMRFMKEGRGMKMSKKGDPVVSKRTQKIIGWVTSCAVNGDGLQVGMAYVDKKSTREGYRIGIFPAEGASKKESIEKHALTVGGRVSLHDEAVILSRFLEASD